MPRWSKGDAGCARAGYRTGIITNNVREFGDGWRALIPVDELFEFVVDSSHVGVRKPDPRIFALALEQLGCPDPASCVFLDDHPANVAAARALGMLAIHVGPDPRRPSRRSRACSAEGRRELFCTFRVR